MPGPRSTTRTSSRPPLTRARTETGLPGAEWRSAFSSRFANARSSCAASARISGRSRSIASRTRSARRRRRRPPRAAPPRPSTSRARGCGRAGLQARQVEQLVDQPRQPRALARDRRPRARAASSSSSAGEPSASAAGDDRGQRGAQVVRDRAQDGGLDLVRAAQRARLDHLARERARARARRRAAPRAPGAIALAPRRARRVARDEQRAEPLLAAQQRDAPRSARRPPPRRARSGTTASPNACAIRCAAGPSARRQVGRAEQDARELGGEVGLAAALLGLRARARGAASATLGGDRPPRRGTRRARPSSPPRRS